MNDITSQKCLADVLPPEFMQGEYETSPAMRYASTTVVRRFDSHERQWPGPQRYVHVWFELTNGRAVGWNENPNRGWTFPVITYVDVQSAPADSIETVPMNIRFTSGTHLRFHRVLMDAEFSFSVSSDGNVEFDYRHPETGIGVKLVMEDTLEAVCLKADGQGVYGADDYTAQQWAGISQPKLDAVEVLRRELNALGLI